MATSNIPCFTFVGSLVLCTARAAISFAVILSYTACAAPTAVAETIVRGETLEFDPEQPITVSMEFILDQTDEDENMPLSVGNFQVRLSLEGQDAGSAVRIVGVSDTMRVQQSRSLDSTSFDATSAFGATFNFGDPFDIDDGAGLMAVDIEIQPEAVGKYLVRIDAGNGDTEFTDPNDFSTLLPYGTMDGVLTIVPEPAGTSLLIAAFWILPWSIVRGPHQLREKMLGN